MRSARHASSLGVPAPGHGSKRGGEGGERPLQDKVAGARAQAGSGLGVKDGTERVGRWLPKLHHAQVLREIHAHRAAVYTSPQSINNWGPDASLVLYARLFLVVLLGSLVCCARIRGSRGTARQLPTIKCQRRQRRGRRP
jgi:hypothetical protein